MLSIIIPTFNEAATLDAVVQRIHDTVFPVAYEIIIVDDHSADHTLKVAHDLQQARQQADASIAVKVLRNRVNKGKGACIRQALKHARGDWIIVQDADLEYHPQDIPSLLEPILQQEADVVYGSRFLKKAWPCGMALPHWVANHLMTWQFNLLYRAQLTDLMTCYKVIPRKLLKALKVRADRFEYDPEMSAKLAKQKVRVVERPINYNARTQQQGKKIRTRDFFIIVGLLFYYAWRMPTQQL